MPHSTGPSGAVDHLVVEDAVRAGAVRQIERLRDYVHAETPTGEAAAIGAFQAKLGERWAELGCAVETHNASGGPHLVAEHTGRGPLAGAAPLLLVTHADTVWPVGTLATQVPWSWTSERITGPGVYDMKAGIVIIDRALEVLAELGLPQRPVRVLVVADEEIGSPSAVGLLRAAAAGCRGALGFEPPHPDGALKLGRFGSTRVRLSVAGVSAHAALDAASGVSAIDELVDQLTQLRSVVAGAEAANPGSVLYNVGTVTGGGRTNVVADAASADLGLRFRDGGAEHAVLGALHALAPVRQRAELTVRLLSSRPAWGGSEADRALHAELTSLAPGLPPARVALGAADTNVTGALGLASLDGFGAQGGGAHAVTEHVRTDSVAERTALLAQLLSAA